jgi:WD40 repeat protein
MLLNISNNTKKVLYRSNKYCVVLVWSGVNEIRIVDFDEECCRTKVIYVNGSKVEDTTHKFDFEKIKVLVTGKKVEGETKALLFNDAELKSLIVIPSKGNKMELHYFYERGFSPLLIFNPKTHQYKVVPIVGSSNDPPTWSPDARKIAFISEKDYAVYIYDVENDSVSQLAWHKYLRFVNPSWSSDGQYLVFASVNRESDMPREKGIFLIELSSKKLIRVTDTGREPALF